MKLKLTNASTTKYFNIIDIATDGSSNNILFLSGMNGETLANSAITNTTYSFDYSPNGWQTVLPAFYAYPSTNRTITGSPAAVAFDTVVTNQGGGYDGSTGVFTAPVPGWYSVNCWYNANGGNAGVLEQPECHLYG